MILVSAAVPVVEVMEAVLAHKLRVVSVIQRHSLRLWPQRLPFSSSEENLFLCTIQVRSRGKNPHSAATSQTRGCEPITTRHLTARTDSAAPSTQDVMEHTLALSPAAVPFQNR